MVESTHLKNAYTQADVDENDDDVPLRLGHNAKANVKN